mmetsp:Transcript_41098/g.70328  ORF Transcript_41098/g.70328 Transcript_41098/m.70328 type:complete len:88 (-) Transcript_41098:64-327(-)
MCERRTDAAVEAKVGPDGLGLLVVSCNDDADNDGLTDGGAAEFLESLCKAMSAKVLMLDNLIVVVVTFLNLVDWFVQYRQCVPTRNV